MQAHVMSDCSKRCRYFNTYIMHFHPIFTMKLEEDVWNSDHIINSWWIRSKNFPIALQNRVLSPYQTKSQQNITLYCLSLYLIKNNFSKDLVINTFRQNTHKVNEKMKFSHVISRVSQTVQSDQTIMKSDAKCKYKQKTNISR